jgi:GntR family transcriptional regulator/MocR family aminotransferase
MQNTKYSKIYSDLISKVKTGSLQAGDKIPSTRELSTLYKCHRFTVMKVCQDLVAEGWLESTERSRYLASRKIPITNSTVTSRRPARNDLSRVAYHLAPIDLERTRYPLEFWGGQPDLRLFPRDEFRRVLASGLKRAKFDLLNYGQTAGLKPCLKEVSEYLRRSRNLIHKDLIMTNGSQEALLLICQTFIKPGDKIAIERKGYPPAWRLFESLGAVLVPIEVDAEGLDTSELQEKLKTQPIKMIYLTPLHQYPTTVTLSPRRRQSLIRLAEKNRIPILEDDYDHEFHFVGPPPPPISAETDLGIYVCSFSKILFPGARLGVIGCDAKISEHLLQRKYLVSRQTDSLTQIGLSAWIKDGGFERHLRRMRRIYGERRESMLIELAKLQAIHNVGWQEPTGGMSVWVNLHKDSKRISELARKRGAFFQHESSMDYLAKKGTHLRIGFAGVNTQEIKQGFSILSEIL